MGECKGCFHAPSRVCPFHQPKGTVEFTKAMKPINDMLAAAWAGDIRRAWRWWEKALRHEVRKGSGPIA